MDGTVTWIQILFVCSLLLGSFGISWRIYFLASKAIFTAVQAFHKELSDVIATCHRIELSLAKDYASREELREGLGELRNAMQKTQSEVGQRIDSITRRAANRA